MKEALEATYRDYNALASALNKVKRSGKAGFLFGEGLFPFTNTPLNILKRGVEYSPAGLVKGMWETFTDVKNGTKTASEAVNDIAKGLSGTPILMVGAFLAASGILKSGASGDDDKDALNTLTGGQNYSIEIDGKSYTIDWAAPVCMPLFVGAEIFNAIQKENVGASLKNILDSMTNEFKSIVKNLDF